MNAPKQVVFDPSDDDADHYRALYERRKAAGLCVRHGCPHDAVNGRVLCDGHRARSQAYWRAAKARREAA